MTKASVTTRLRVLVEEEGPRGAMVIFEDQDGAQIGALAVDVVPVGVRVEAWTGDDFREWQHIVHRTTRVSA